MIININIRVVESMKRDTKGLKVEVIDHCYYRRLCQVLIFVCDFSNIQGGSNMTGTVYTCKQV